jgi:hypothetical protein
MGDLIRSRRQIHGAGQRSECAVWIPIRWRRTTSCIVVGSNTSWLMSDSEPETICLGDTETFVPQTTRQLILDAPSGSQQSAPVRSDRTHRSVLRDTNPETPNLDGTEDGPKASHQFIVDGPSGSQEFVAIWLESRWEVRCLMPGCDRSLPSWSNHVEKVRQVALEHISLAHTVTTRTTDP